MASTRKPRARPETEPAADPVARLAAELRPHAADWPQARFLLAFSAGLDSRVLLELLVRLRARSPFALRAVHINHHLQPAAAGLARAARDVCRRLDVPCRVRHACGIVASGESLEARARVARYALLAQELRAGEILLTAQHCDDQLETVLLQLFRGAGLPGLAAMPAAADFGRGRLVRPLLAWQRSELAALAGRWRLAWADDPSNLDTRFDRNFLRRDIIPALQRRWPALATTVARSAAHIAAAAELIKSQALDDLRAIQDGAALNMQKLRDLPIARQGNAVRQWLRLLGLTVPDQTHLRRVLGELTEAGPDRHPEVRWPGGCVWRDRGQLRAAAKLPPRALLLAGATATPWDWRAAPYGGLRWQADAQGPVDGKLLPALIELRPRTGGERLRPSAHGARRALKDLLREAAVPVRERAALPLLYADGELLAVGARWINFGHPAVCRPALEPGRFVANNLLRSHRSTPQRRRDPERQG